MTDASKSRRAIEDANADLREAGLPTIADLLHALALVLENSDNVHANTCVLFSEPRRHCNCALGVARGALAQFCGAA